MVASSIDLVPQGNGEVQRPLMSITPVKVGKSSGPEFFLPHLKNGHDFFNEHQHQP